MVLKCSSLHFSFARRKRMRVQRPHFTVSGTCRPNHWTTQSRDSVVQWFGWQLITYMSWALWAWRLCKYCIQYNGGQCTVLIVYKGGFLRDIILLTLCHYHRGTNPIKCHERFLCLCSHLRRIVMGKRRKKSNSTEMYSFLCSRFLTAVMPTPKNGPCRALALFRFRRSFKLRADMPKATTVSTYLTPGCPSIALTVSMMSPYVQLLPNIVIGLSMHRP